MESTKADYVVDRVDAERYEPEIIDGTQVGEVHQIEPTGNSAEKLDASLWRSDPATYDYLFEGDEAFHVVEGAATVELPDTGETIELRDWRRRVLRCRHAIDLDDHAAVQEVRGHSQLETFSATARARAPSSGRRGLRARRGRRSGPRRRPRVQRGWAGMAVDQRVADCS